MLFRPVDLFFYDKVFYPFCEWLHKWFGFGSLVIAKWLLWVGFALMLLSLGTLVAVPWDSISSSHLGHVYLTGLMLLIEAYFAHLLLQKAIALEKKVSESQSGELLLTDFRDGPNEVVRTRRFFLFVSTMFLIVMPSRLAAPEHWFLVLPETLRIVSVAVVLAGSYFLAMPPRLPKTGKIWTSHLTPTRAQA